MPPIIPQAGTTPNCPAEYPAHPAHLWAHFFAISQIPRPSGQEAAVRQYVLDQAAALGCESRMDDAGNVVLQVPASAGQEQRETVIIQNHLDMVTVKSSDKSHDFARDPLQLVVEDGWLRADRTTLGADNGVGCAAALALLTDPEVVHPPLELLFTVDEETGLHGALALDPALLSGCRMLNLDTEDWNELFVGCAGGAGWQFRKPLSYASAATGLEYWTLAVAGLAGGHSGIQIHEQLGNAIKLLGQIVVEFRHLQPELQLCAAEAGVAHNVIPREGCVTFVCEAGAGDALRERLEHLRLQMLGWLPAADAGLSYTLTAVAEQPAISVEDTASVLDLLSVFPHGALAYNAQSPADLVDLSINLAIWRLDADGLFIESSYRFFNEAQSVPLQQSVLALARTFSLQVESIVGYPGWQPDFASPLLHQASALHQSLFAIEPEVKAIHAGLECGILKSKKPDVDILSFGPTIRGAHSPKERLEIATVGPFWRFLTALLAQM